MCSLSRPCPFSRCQDVLKTRAQLHAGGGEGMAAILRGIVREQGVAGLYRGIASPIFAEAPKRAWKFTANGVLRDHGLHPVAAGAMAGFTEALVNTPFETVKVQMQAKENLGRFKGTADCAAQLLRGEGPLGFYKGFQAQAMRNLVWNGVYFGFIGVMSKRYPTPAGAPKARRLGQKFVLGACGSMMGTLPV